MDRPQPPADMVEATIDAPWFKPAPELLEWMTSAFIEEGGPLGNPDHGHLVGARIGVLWTNVRNTRHGRVVVGQCEFKPPGGTMGKWAKARAQAQLRGWFGDELDFLLTFDAGHAARASDAEFCALVEHELYHCGQASDEFGAPKFIESTGLPVYQLRGHDIEEFVGVVRRYGAVTQDIGRLLEAAQGEPEVSAVSVASVCGTCHAPEL
jgi:hypothetical protein